MELRGFDSYPIMLGDEMRGERASLGKTLEDAERDLRIKQRMIVAIENCDLEGFPNRSVVAGYVRSYARYLGMDPEDCYQRFCAESGYQSPVAMMAQQAAGSRRSPLPLLPVGTVAAEIAHSRFAAPPARSRFMAPVSLGAVTSAAALLALMAGLSYGAWALLQDIQRVGFAPIPEAPAVVAQAPLIAAPEVEPGALPLPDARVYQDGGILAAAVIPAQLQPIEALRRDGPISAIDPRTAGVFGREAVGGQDREAFGVAGIGPAYRSAPGREPMGQADDGGADRMASPTVREAEAMTIAEAVELVVARAEAAPAPAPKGITLHAAEDAWIRVRERDNVIFEGILNAGQSYDLPPRTDAPVLKAGNAGGIFVVVDGVPYGPLGQRGQIAREVSLLAEHIRETVPQAASLTLVPASGPDLQQRAEALAAR
jgi:hypothetical protein